MFYSFTSYGLNKRLSIFTMVVDTTEATHNTIKVGWINDGESPKISCHIKKCGILLPPGGAPRRSLRVYWGIYGCRLLGFVTLNQSYTWTYLRMGSMDNTFHKQAKLFDDCKFEHNPSSDQCRLVLSLIHEKYFPIFFAGLENPNWIYFLLIFNFRPGISQTYRQVKHGFSRLGFKIGAEESLALKLELGSRFCIRQTWFQFATY